jgi:hypothetical protein
MPILADDMSKFFTVVVIAIVWGIGAIASAVKKANEEAARRRASQPTIPRPVSSQRQTPTPIGRRPVVAQGSRRAPIPPRPAIAQQAQLWAQMTGRSTPPALPQRRVIPSPPPLRQPAPPPPRVATAPRMARPAAQPAAAVDQAAPRAHRTASAAVGAAVIRRWLRPGVLRRQFILTELLQPPLALRENHE